MTSKQRPNRRTILGSGLAGAGALALGGRRAVAQPSEVKIALIVPLSGPWARSGQLKKMGGDLAVKHINEQGGIKALGGAKLRMISIDGATTSKRRRTPPSGWCRRNPTSLPAAALGCLRSRSP